MRGIDCPESPASSIARLRRKAQVEYGRSLLPLMPAKAGIQLLVLGPRLRGDERFPDRTIPMHEIPIGAQGSASLVVRPEHLANQFKDSILPQVFATPMMVLLMENAALNAIRAYLEPGESAVGAAIDIEHIAATP